VAAADASSPAEAPAAAAEQTPVASAEPAAESPKPQPPKAAKPAPSRAASESVVAGRGAVVPPASQTIPAGGNVDTPVPPLSEPVQLPVAEPAPPEPPPPPQKVFEELVVSADSVIGLRIESTVSSEVAKVEDPVEARVTRDVRVGSDVAIPAGSRVLGSVTQVERGGKLKNAARIGVRFHTVVLADNTRMPMQTEAIFREGKSPGQESAAKVGGAAVGGAILGAIIGGGKGAAIGGAVGAAGGTGVAMAGGRNPAVLTSGTALTVRLTQPVRIIIERDEF
jgi:type IV secretory pathway VirB10-like protein